MSNQTHYQEADLERTLPKTTSRRALFTAGAAGAAGFGLMGGTAHAQGPGNDPFVHKDRMPINVKDYGAVGDGVTDDLAAIQAAIDDAASPGAVGAIYEPAHDVFFPAGKYAVSSTVHVTASNVYLVGESGGSFLVRRDGNHDPYVLAFVGRVEGDNFRARDFIARNGIRNLAIGEGIRDTEFTGAPEGGLLIQYAIQFSVVGCSIDGHNGPGISLVYAFTGNILQNFIRHCVDAITCDGVTNTLHITDNRIQANLGLGIRMPSAEPEIVFPNSSGRANGVHISGNTIEGNGAEAILFTDGIYRGPYIAGNYFELNFNPIFTQEIGPHIRKIAAGTVPQLHEFQGITIVGNNFHPPGGTSVSVSLAEGTNGILAGNNFNVRPADPLTKGYEFGDGAKGWIINQSEPQVPRGEPDPSLIGPGLEVIGDAEIADPSNGLILGAPDGTRFRLRVDATGAVITEAVT